VNKLITRASTLRKPLGKKDSLEKIPTKVKTNKEEDATNFITSLAKRSLVEFIFIINLSKYN
jgi:hypothetical protein